MAFSEIALKALLDVVGEENATGDPVKCQAYSRSSGHPTAYSSEIRSGLPCVRPVWSCRDQPQKFRLFTE